MSNHLKTESLARNVQVIKSIKIPDAPKGKPSYLLLIKSEFEIKFGEEKVSSPIIEKVKSFVPVPKEGRYDLLIKEYLINNARYLHVLEIVNVTFNSEERQKSDIKGKE